MDDLLEPIHRIEELRAIEARANDAPLMERAGRAATAIALQMAGDRGGSIVVLAGPGNNGGDGFVVARVLREAFHDVAVVFRGHAAKLPKDALAAHRAYVDAGGAIVTDPPSGQPALIVDALYGIGFARPLTKPWAQLVEWANASGAPILALDIPTGLHADTGIATAPAIRASATATFIAWKAGLLTATGPDLCGNVTLETLGLVQDPATPPAGRRLAWDGVARALPDVLRRRARNVHKGTFGTLAIIGGADGMTGASILAGRAALRLGAGKVCVYLAARERPTLDPGAPELMLRAADDVTDDATAIVIGPGLGTDDSARAHVERAVNVNVPLVLDADALNLVAANKSLRGALRGRTAPTLLTPHPAEAARLLGTDTSGVQRDRLHAAMLLARELRAHVVVKGAGSVLAHPDDTWDINASGNAGLACAGSGDVLAGMLGALVAQRIDAKTALRVAVCLHGAAADALVAAGRGPLGLPPSELPDAARDLVNRAR